MDLSPYLAGLRRDLLTAAEPGGADVSRAAELLGNALDSAARLAMLEALADAAAEITTQLSSASVEVRLRGRDAELVVTEAVQAPAAPYPAPGAGSDGGDVARITLRLPEQLKEQVERVAAAEGISVNAWLVRAVAAAVAAGLAAAGNQAAQPPGRSRPGRRLTGFAQA